MDYFYIDDRRVKKKEFLETLKKCKRGKIERIGVDRKFTLITKKD